MKFIATNLKDVYEIELTPNKDERGLFARTFCKKEFESIGHTEEFVQFNHSCTREKGVIRGMHFQLPPVAESKLIRVIKGEIYDVIVDLRKDSPTFLQHVGVELSAHNWRMIYIPKGFAHGFQTLSNDVEMLYHHTEFYEPQHERGLKFDDPSLDIQWPLPTKLVSPRDMSHPLISDGFEGLVL